MVFIYFHRIVWDSPVLKNNAYAILHETFQVNFCFGKQRSPWQDCCQTIILTLHIYWSRENHNQDRELFSQQQQVSSHFSFKVMAFGKSFGQQLGWARWGVGGGWGVGGSCSTVPEECAQWRPYRSFSCPAQILQRKLTNVALHKFRRENLPTLTILSWVG